MERDKLRRFKVLDYLKAGNTLTTEELSEKFGGTRAAAWLLLRRLMGAGEVTVLRRLAPPLNGGSPPAVYGIGSSEPAVYQPVAARLVKWLEEHGEATKHQLAEAFSVHPNTAQQAARRCIEEGTVHITRYERGSKQPVAYYAAGAGKNATPLRALSSAVRGRRYRKEHPDVVLNDILRKRAKRQAQRKKVKVPQEFSFLYGSK